MRPSASRAKPSATHSTVSSRNISPSRSQARLPNSSARSRARMLSNQSQTSAARKSKVDSSSIGPFYMGSVTPRFKPRGSGRGAGIAPVDRVDAGQRLGIELDFDAVDVLLQL